MAKNNPPESAALSRAKLFFFISGATALVYEVVWLRLLGLIFGNTTHAVSTVLAAYMAGLGVGSFVIGKLAGKWKNPLKAYGLLEGGIGVYAALTPALLLLIQHLFAWFSGVSEPSSAYSLGLKFLFSFIVVFVPTFLMGGTLPVLIKLFLDEKQQTGPVTALLYSLNTVGAVTGTVLAGFWLLPFLGTKGSLYLCAFLNLAIAGTAILLSRDLEWSKPAAPEKHLAPIAQSSGRSLVLPLGLFLSGACAMMYEVGWTRILATVLSSSTYAFTLMLASFLLGMAAGSAVWKKVLQHRGPSGLQWAWLQTVIALSALLTMPLYPWVSLFVVRLYGLTVGHPGLLFFCMSLVCLALMVVPAFCFGALFPLSSALYSGQAPDAPARIGRLYLWNTLGNITGSVLTGFILIPAVGIHRAILTAVVIGALMAAAAVWVVQRKPFQNALIFVMACGMLVTAADLYPKGWDVRLLSSGLNIDASLVVGQKTEAILSKLFNHRVIYYREGLNAIVAVGQEGENVYLKVNGKTDASTQGDLATQMLLGHLPHLLHPNPKRSLVIGYGSGMTLAAALAHPIEQADCAEIEPAVMEASRFFESVNRGAERDARTRIIRNDGRNHLFMEKKPYDVIISEPSNPWMAGISYLFTVEFYRLVEKRLNPGGIFCQWLHAYAMEPADFWMVAASIREAFPHVTVWRANSDDYLLIASREPFSFQLDALESRFAGNPTLRKDLKPLGIEGAAGLLARYQFGEETLAKFVADAGVNTDDFLPLEFSTPYSLYDSDDTLKNDLARAASKEKLPPLVTSSAPPALERKDVLVQIGKAYLEMGEAAKARAYFEIPQNDPDAMTGLARCYSFEGKKRQAMALFEQAQTAEAYDFLGRHQLEAELPEKALESFDAALRLNESSWQIHFWKAKSLEALDRWAEAAASYGRALDLGGPKLGLRLSRDAAWMKSGQNSQVQDDLMKLRDEFPTHYPIYEKLKFLYLSQENLDPLIRVYEQFVDANPYFRQAWIDLLAFYLKKGDEEKVRWALAKAQAAHA